VVRQHQVRQISTEHLCTSICATIPALQMCSSPQDMAHSPVHSPRYPVASGPALMAELFGTEHVSLEKAQLFGLQAQVVVTREPRLDSPSFRIVNKQPHSLGHYWDICCTYFLPGISGDGSCLSSRILSRHRRKTSGFILGLRYRSLLHTLSEERKGTKEDARKNSPQFRLNPRSYNLSSGSTGATILSPPLSDPGMHI